MAAWDDFEWAGRMNRTQQGRRPRTPARRTIGGFAAIATLVAGAAPAGAQSISDRMTFEPGGGVLFDAYRNDGGDGAPGWIGAVRFAFDVGGTPSSVRGGWRVAGELARAETSEAGTAVLADTVRVVFRSEWWLATAGVEWDVVDAWTGLSIEGRAGAAWLQREVTGGDPIPPGTPGTREPGSQDARAAVVVGGSAYRHLTHRVQARIRVVDVITDPLDRIEHSPAVTLGLRFSFD